MGFLSNKIWVRIFLSLPVEQNCSYDGKLAVEDDVIIRLQTTSFSSFSREQTWNVLDASRQNHKWTQTCMTSSTGCVEADQQISYNAGCVYFFSLISVLSSAHAGKTMWTICIVKVLVAVIRLLPQTAISLSGDRFFTWCPTSETSDWRISGLAKRKEAATQWIKLCAKILVTLANV